MTVHHPTLVTDEGRMVTVRPIRADDAAALVQFHEQLSPETVYLRFFSSHQHLTAEEIEHFTQVDGSDRYTVVAEHQGQLVAVARYDRLDDQTKAEAAFVVADAWQHHGIGGLLLKVLVDAARQHGIEELVAVMLFSNRLMLRVFSDSGLPFQWTSEEGVIEVRLSL